MGFCNMRILSLFLTLTIVKFLDGKHYLVETGSSNVSGKSRLSKITWAHGDESEENADNLVKNKEAGEDYSQVPIDHVSEYSDNPKNCKFTSCGRWQKDGPCPGSEKSRERKCLCEDGKKGSPYHQCGDAMDCQCKRTKKRCPVISQHFKEINACTIRLK